MTRDRPVGRVEAALMNGEHRLREPSTRADAAALSAPMIASCVQRRGLRLADDPRTRPLDLLINLSTTLEK